MGGIPGVRRARNHDEVLVHQKHRKAGSRRGSPMDLGTLRRQRHGVGQGGRDRQSHRCRLGDGTDFTTLTWRFLPIPDDSTYVEIEETGLTGNGDEVACYATNSVGGFTMVLCAAKALLEHDVVLTAVLDHRPDCP